MAPRNTNGKSDATRQFKPTFHFSEDCKYKQLTCGTNQHHCLDVKLIQILAEPPRNDAKLQG